MTERVTGGPGEPSSEKPLVPPPTSTEGTVGISTSHATNQSRRSGPNPAPAVPPCYGAHSEHVPRMAKWRGSITKPKVDFTDLASPLKSCMGASTVVPHS